MEGWGGAWGRYMGSGVLFVPYLGSLFGVPLGSHQCFIWGPISALFGVPSMPYVGSHWGPIDALFGAPIWDPYLGSHGGFIEVPLVPYLRSYLGSLCGVPMWGPIGVPYVPYLGSHRCPIWGPI